MQIWVQVPAHLWPLIQLKLDERLFLLLDEHVHRPPADLGEPMTVRKVREESIFVTQPLRHTFLRSGWRHVALGKKVVVGVQSGQYLQQPALIRLLLGEVTRVLLVQQARTSSPPLSPQAPWQDELDTVPVGPH